MLNAALLQGALVRRYLRVEPADELDEFFTQHDMALALEQRHFEQLAAIVANALARALGGK